MKCIRKKRMLIYIMSMVLEMILAGCGMEQSRKLTHVDTAMGTVVQQTLYVQPGAQSVKEEESLPRELMDLLNSLEKESLSWREETSEIYRINLAEEKIGCALSPDMKGYLETIGEVWKNSSGALDVTVGSVTGLWDIDTYAVEKSADFRIPAEQELRSALAATGFEKVNVNDGRIYLPEDIKLDLGGVGKGIACD